MKSKTTIKNYDLAIEKYEKSGTMMIDYFKTLTYSNQKMFFAALKGKYGYCAEFEDLKKYFKKAPYQKATDTFDMQEMLRIRQLALSSDQRTAAIVLCQLDAGVRRGEVNNLFLACKEQGLRCLERNVITISGKGSKHASVFLDKELTEVISNGINSPDFKPCSIETVGNVTKKILSQVDATGSCHDLRRAFATNLRNHKTPVEMIQILLRHDDIKTTIDYLKITHDQLFDSLNKRYIDMNEFVNLANYEEEFLNLYNMNRKLVEENKKLKEELEIANTALYLTKVDDDI